jgi:hypothetical protein
MARLPGFPTPSLPCRGASSGNAAASGIPPSEWAIVLAFTLAGLLFRGYALTENPSAFEGETLPMMLGSYTGYGLRYYLTTEFLGTGNGIFHALTHYAFFRLFGASIFTIRLVSVFWGVLAIPLLYLLGRRIAGRGAASAAAALFITAPEQLCWSRGDNTFFPPVAVLAIVTAHLCLSLQERFTPGDRRGSRDGGHLISTRRPGFSSRCRSCSRPTPPSSFAGPSRGCASSRRHSSEASSSGPWASRSWSTPPAPSTSGN